MSAVGKAVITVTSSPDGLIDISAEFDPPINGADHDKNPTSHFIAMRMIEAAARLDDDGVDAVMGSRPDRRLMMVEYTVPDNPLFVWAQSHDRAMFLRIRSRADEVFAADKKYGEEEDGQITWAEAVDAAVKSLLDELDNDTRTIIEACVPRV